MVHIRNQQVPRKFVKDVQLPKLYLKVSHWDPLSTGVHLITYICNQGSGGWTAGVKYAMKLSQLKIR